MRRLYYLSDDLHTCQRIGEMLAEFGIREWNFHVLSRDEIGLYQHRVHAAATYHRLDVVPVGERWAIGGALLGLALAGSGHLAGLLPWSNGVPLLVVMAIGALVGGWSGALRGLFRDNYKIARFRAPIDAGRHLVMIDVGERNRTQVREHMTVRFPSVEFCGRDTTYMTPFVPRHA